MRRKSEQGKPVLTVAFEYRNDKLIKYLLTHYIELVKINTSKLREAVAHSNKYKEMFEEAKRKSDDQNNYRKRQPVRIEYILVEYLKVILYSHWPLISVYL